MPDVQPFHPAMASRRVVWGAFFGSMAVALQRKCLVRLAARGNRHLPEHLRVGERGELEALFFLRREGYTVVERRWRCPEWNGDLDLIAWDGETLCFVEVKTRTARDETPAGSAVDEAKRAMLRKMARAYRRTLPREQAFEAPVRFDLVSVYLLGAGAEQRVECEAVRGAFPAIAARRSDGKAHYGV